MRERILPGRVRNWIEARSYWGLVARVNLIRKVASLTLVHNLIRRGALLRMAGVEL
jgi:hypothetical protein